VLATGFGATVAMWVMAYLAMMRPGLLLGELIFAAMLGCLVVAGFVAGRWTSGGPRCGVLVGLVSATLNLMLVGAIVADQEDSAGLKTAALRWGIGTYVVSILLATTGAAIGTMRRGAGGDVGRAPNWIFGFVCVAAVAVFLLLITGGLVTALEVGLAVPDWPNSFGHNMLLYPLSEMTQGVYYEHTHRLSGMLVGVTTITLLFVLLVYDRRGWLCGLGLALLAGVCFQGVMGGLRVTVTSTALAVIHGVFGQVVFATTVLVAAFVSTSWIMNTSPQPREGSRTDRRLSVVSLVMLLVQLALGALYRHLNADPEVPPGLSHGLLGLHLIVAIIVTVHIVLVGVRGWSRYADVPILHRLGGTMIGLVSLQILLGIGAFSVVMMRRDPETIPVSEVAFTTAHQVTGALLLGGAALTVAWTRRLLS
jgi:cytochrome c oxidase assembly protein subunit 15